MHLRILINTFGLQEILLLETIPFPLCLLSYSCLQLQIKNVDVDISVSKHLFNDGENKFPL